MMKSMMKRGFALVVALAMCVGMLSLTAFAQDAYYYLKVDANGEELEITEQDQKDGKGLNTGATGAQWVFVGKGEAPDEVTSEPVEFEDGELPEGYVAPEAGEAQEFDGGHYFVDGERRSDTGTATINPFHDIGKYEYYDGEGEVPEYSYTVTWDEAKQVDTGFNFNSDECGEDGIEQNKGQWSGYYPDHNIRFELGTSTVHVDGTATLSTNTGVKVTVKMYGEDAETVTDENGEDATKYVLKGTQLADAAVTAAADNIAGSKDIDLDNFELNITEVQNEETGKTSYLGEYVEKTYTVSYTVSGAQNSSSTATYGKQTQGDEAAADLTSYTTSEGTYRFTGWELTVDADGNKTYTAVCTFIPFYNPADLDLGGLTEIEDEAVPLAGLFTRADAVGYLWQQAGEPEAELSDFEDVPEDHMWAVAIGWAQDVGIAVADQEGNFRPDDLVLRWVEDHEAEPEGEFEEFLNRYAEYAGIELDADELFIELGGEPEDIVMGEDAQVIFDDFFAKLEEALEELAA